MTEAGSGARSWTVLLTLGSNVDPEKNLLAALDALDARFGIEAVSAIYEAEPVGAPGTPRFLNAAARVTTDCDPATLKLETFRPLEASLGRVRGPDRNAPRTIDIDVAGVLGPSADGTERLDARDPEIALHAHLALPLADVAPELVHPDEGISLEAIAARFVEADGIRRREDLQWRRP